jgi:S1-C subfamily serine protease
VWSIALLAGTIGALLGISTTYALSGPRTRVVTVPAIVQQMEPPPAAASSAPAANTPADLTTASQRARPAIVRLSSGANTASGVLFRSDGYILTAARVADGDDALAAVLADGRRVTARVTGIDAGTGIAVLKLDGEGYPVATLGSAVSLEPGQAAVVMGYPGNEAGPSATTGTVRSVGRTVDDGTGRKLIGMIQTDAPIGAGAWGGALLDARGAVIGIMWASDSQPGLADATPIDLAYSAANQLISGLQVTHAWLGIGGKDLDPGTAKALGIVGGAVVEQVQTLSPAAVAGLQPGDLITAVDGHPVASMADLMVTLRSYHPGDRVFLDVRRANVDQVISTVLVEVPASSS